MASDRRRIEATAAGRTFSSTTDGSGHFELFLGGGSYTMTASALGYQSALATGVEIETDLTTTQDFFLAPLPLRDVSGTVTAEDGSPLEGAEVRALGTPVGPATTDANGECTLTLPIGANTIRIAAGGCSSSEEADVTLTLPVRRSTSPSRASSMTSATDVAPVVDVALDAPVAGVEPTELAASGGPGDRERRRTAGTGCGSSSRAREAGEFERIMDVFGEGQLRSDNLDVAGRVGRWRALSLTFDARCATGSSSSGSLGRSASHRS